MNIKKLLLGLLLLCITTLSFAKVELPDGIYHQTETEMVIKTAGLDFEVTRTWYQGQWHFNIDWQNLTFQHRVLSGGYIAEVAYSRNATRRSDSTQLANISRGRYLYKGQGNDTFVYDERKRIEVTETGYRWFNRVGDWIDYDSAGRATQYGFRGDVQGVIVRDSEYHVIGLKDPQGQQILTYEYNSDNRVIAISDNSIPARRVSYRYEDGHLVEAIDVLGHSRFYHYDQDQLIQYTDGNGHPTRIEYHLNHRVKSVLAQDNIGWSYVYDYDKVKKEFYVRQSHSSGRTIESWFDEKSRLIRKDENGETIQTTKYGPYNQTETITDRRGLETVKEYDVYHNLIKTTYPDGSFTSRKVDLQFSNVTEEVNENGVITRYEYNGQGYRTAMIEAVGADVERRTEYQTNERGWVTKVKRVGDNSTEESTVNLQYDTAGNLIQFTDALGQVTTYTYDNAGNRLNLNQTNEQGQSITTTFQRNAKGWLIQKTEPLGQYTQFSYDKNGNLLVQTDYNQSHSQLSQQQFQYDNRNNLIAKTNTLGHQTTYQYDPRDNLILITDTLGNTQTFIYDLFNRKTDSIDASGYKVSLIYGESGSENAGRVIKVDYPTYTESRLYDTRGRLTQTIKNSKLPDSSASTNQSTVYTYDTLGNRISTQDAKNRTTQYTFDALNRQIQSTDNDGETTTYSYDNRDNLLSVTDANGHVIRRYSYDANNQNISETKPEGQQDTLVYNTLGLLSQSTDAMGQVTVYTYNPNQQLIGMDRYASSSDPAPQKSITFIYNDQGQLQSYNDGSTSATYQYNARGQKTNETLNYGPFTKSHAYTYDNNGQKSSFTNAEGLTTNYLYTPDNQIEQIELPGIGYITYHYTNGQVEQISFPGNTNQYWRYDGLQRPESILVQDIAQSTLDSRDYHYDKANNIVEQINREGKLAYQYNNLDRLSQVNFTEHADLTPDHNHNTTYPPQDEQYSYDSVGNRLTSHETEDSWQYNANNELLQYTQDGENISFQYNANGQMTQKTVAGTTTYYEYNIDGRLQAIKNQEQQLIATYAYDPFGRRISKTRYSHYESETGIQTTTTTTYYQYSDEGLIAEYNENGALIQSYGYAPNSPFTTNPLYSHRPDFTDSSGYVYYINDHLGTPKKLITNNGRMVWFGESEAFGDTQLVKDEYPNPLRFPGQYYDDESGLHYNFYRYYDPNIGRYITSDPLSLLGGINSYQYALSNPLFFYDVLGLYPGQKYPSRVEAAMAALRYIHKYCLKNKIEYGGIIYRNPDGSYSFSEPKKGKEAEVKIDYGDCPEDSKTVASYHCHGAPNPKYESEKFSPQDILTDTSHGVPGYLGTPEGDVYFHDPSTGSKPISLGDNALGKPVSAW